MRTERSGLLCGGTAHIRPTTCLTGLSEAHPPPPIIVNSLPSCCPQESGHSLRRRGGWLGTQRVSWSSPGQEGTGVDARLMSQERPRVPSALLVSSSAVTSQSPDSPGSGITRKMVQIRVFALLALRETHTHADTHTLEHKALSSHPPGCRKLWGVCVCVCVYACVYACVCDAYPVSLRNKERGQGGQDE